MGGVILKIASKKGKDKKLSTKYDSLLDIPAVDVDGVSYKKLEELIGGKKCVMVINTASK